jgi:DNA-binding MarR family transcriptional regulator
MAKVWGVIVPSKVYHTNRTCVSLVERVGGFKVFREYESEHEAFMAGHTEPCPTCPRILSVMDEELKMIRLTVEQIDTMQVVQRQFDETKLPLTLSAIAKARGRKISTCHTMVKTLVKKGLLAKKMARVKASNGSVIPTAAGRRVLAKALLIIR